MAIMSLNWSLLMKADIKVKAASKGSERAKEILDKIRKRSFKGRK